jgi:hypothetical protein
MPLLAWLYKDFMYTGRRFWGTLVALFASTFKPAWGRRLRICRLNQFNSKSKKQVLLTALILTVPIAGNSAKRRSS